MKKYSFLLVLALVVVFVSSCSLLQRNIVVKTCPNCGYASETRVCSACNFDSLWQTTMSEEEAKSLLGKSPEEVALAIKTVGDARLYIKANGMEIAKKSYMPQYGDWSFARTGYEEIITNSCNSKDGFANFVSHVLDGDYDEVGQIKWVGMQSSTINYVLCGNLYYPFDITSDNYDYFDTGLVKLKEFGSSDVRFDFLDMFIEENELSDAFSEDAYLIVCLETTSDRPFFVPFYVDGKIVHVPSGEADNFEVLYWKYAGESVKDVDLDALIAPYNSKLKEVNEFPGKINKNHPLYRSK